MNDITKSEFVPVDELMQMTGVSDVRQLFTDEQIKMRKMAIAGRCQADAMRILNGITEADLNAMPTKVRIDAASSLLKMAAMMEVVPEESVRDVDEVMKRLKRASAKKGEMV